MKAPDVWLCTQLYNMLGHITNKKTVQYCKM